jgi:hypothetical protein
MPIGFAGRATAGRLSGAGTEADFVRVGLGDGVADADSDSEGWAATVGSAVGVDDGEAAAAGGPDAEGVGLGDGVAVATDDDVGLGALGTVGGGEPVGAAVHPASTPAHTSPLRATTERLTWSG